MEKTSEKSFKIIHYTFVTPMEYTWRLYTLATTIPLVTSPENSSKEGTKCPPNVKSGKQHLFHVLEGFFALTFEEEIEKLSVLFHSLPSCITNQM